MNKSGGNRPKGAISKKYIFLVPMQTVSPLRIASGRTDNITDVLVLKNKEGKAFIPATSLAGVLRNEIRKIYGEALTVMIFGGADKNNDGAQSMLALNDIVLESTKIITRDGVHIHEVAGTAVRKEKYDFEAVEKGAKGTLTMEITVREGNISRANDAIDKGRCENAGCFLHIQYLNSKDIFSEIAATLADLLTAGVHVGSLSTKGMGLIRSIAPVKVYKFNFVKEEETNNEESLTVADAWLSYVTEERLPPAEYVARSLEGGEGLHLYGNLDISASFAIKSSLLVRDASRISDYEIDKEKYGSLAGVPMKSGNDYVIPGTSIKGALRGKAYKILLSLPGADHEKVKEFLSDFMGSAKDDRNKKASEQRGRKSNLLIDEMYFAGNSHLYEMKQTRNRIDRFTGATIDNALFSEYVVWQKDKGIPTLQMNLQIIEASHAQTGLMMLLLRELWTGNLPLGGGKNVGRGVLQGICAEIHYEGWSYRLEQVLPLGNGSNDINLTGTNSDKESLSAEQVMVCLQKYVTELVEYISKQAGE